MKLKSLLIISLILTLTSCTTNHQKVLNQKIEQAKPLIKIITDSKRYKLGESIDIEVTSKKEGFVNIFLINPKLEVIKVKNSPIKEELRSYLKTVFTGEYQLIAIFTKHKTDIKLRNFSLKNLGEKDIYDIYKFKISD